MVQLPSLLFKYNKGILTTFWNGETLDARDCLRVIWLMLYMVAKSSK
jgi:hypothetical protein